MSVKKNLPEAEDILQIDDMELNCHVGCTPEERAQQQTLLVSLKLFVPPRLAGKKDELKNTLNYATLMDKLRERLCGQTFKLIETVAEQIAQTALEFPLLLKVEVKVTKTSLIGIKSVSAIIQRQK